MTAETMKRWRAVVQAPAESRDSWVPDLLTCCVIQAKPHNLSECPGHPYNEEVTLDQSFLARDGV